MKEDQETKGQSDSFLPEEEIQKIIFDRKYLTYVKQKIREELHGSAKFQSKIDQKLDKLQKVQYQCIKAELKEEYEKKITNVRSKMQRQALKDP